MPGLRGLCLSKGSQSPRGCVVSTLVALSVLGKSHLSITCPLSQLTTGNSFLQETEDMNKRLFFFLLIPCGSDTLLPWPSSRVAFSILATTSSAPVLGMPLVFLLNIHSDSGKLILGLSKEDLTGLSRYWTCCTSDEPTCQWPQREPLIWKNLHVGKRFWRAFILSKCLISTFKKKTAGPSWSRLMPPTAGNQDLILNLTAV